MVGAPERLSVLPSGENATESFPVAQISGLETGKSEDSVVLLQMDEFSLNTTVTSIPKILSVQRLDESAVDFAVRTRGGETEGKNC